VSLLDSAVYQAGRPHAHHPEAGPRTTEAMPTGPARHPDATRLRPSAATRSQAVGTRRLDMPRTPRGPMTWRRRHRGATPQVAGRRPRSARPPRSRAGRLERCGPRAVSLPEGASGLGATAGPKRDPQERARRPRLPRRLSTRHSDPTSPQHAETPEDSASTSRTGGRKRCPAPSSLDRRCQSSEVPSPLALARFAPAEPPATLTADRPGAPSTSEEAHGQAAVDTSLEHLGGAHAPPRHL
jgi:hypothetical protein